MRYQVISFNCLLKNKLGHVISTSYNREVLTGTNQPGSMLTGLCKGLDNLKKGEKRSIAVSAEEAYGLYDPRKVILYPRSKLPKALCIGQVVNITSKTNVIRTYKVQQIMENMVSLDGNHTLAGQDLIFEIEALEARDATADEIAESTNLVSTQRLH